MSETMFKCLVVLKSHYAQVLMGIIKCLKRLEDGFNFVKASESMIWWSKLTEYYLF